MILLKLLTQIFDNTNLEPSFFKPIAEHEDKEMFMNRKKTSILLFFFGFIFILSPLIK